MHNPITFTVILESPCLLPNLPVIGGQHPPFAGCGHDFILAKGESRGIPDRADRPPFVFCPMGLGTVFNNFKSMFPRHFQYRIHVTGPAGKMNGDNRPGTGGNHGAEGFGRHVLADRIDVGHHWHAAAHDNSTGRSDKRPAGSHYLIAGGDAQGMKSQFESNSSIGQGNGVIATGDRGKTPLKKPPFFTRPIIDLAAFQNPDGSGNVIFLKCGQDAKRGFGAVTAWMRRGLFFSQ